MTAGNQNQLSIQAATSKPGGSGAHDVREERVLVGGEAERQEERRGREDPADRVLGLPVGDEGADRKQGERHDREGCVVPNASVLRPTSVVSDRSMKTSPTTMIAAMGIQANGARRVRVDCCLPARGSPTGFSLSRPVCAVSRPHGSILDQPFRERYGHA